MKNGNQKQQSRKPSTARVKINNTEINQQQELDTDKLERKVQQLVEKYARPTRYNSNTAKSSRRDSTWYGNPNMRTQRRNTSQNDMHCTRCCRNNHTEKDCFAKTTRPCPEHNDNKIVALQELRAGEVVEEVNQSEVDLNCQGLELQ